MGTNGLKRTKPLLGGLSFQTNDIGVALLVPALVAVILQPIIFARVGRSKSLQLTFQK